MDEKENEVLKIETLNSEEKNERLYSLSIEQSIKKIKKERKKKKFCHFPSAHTILLILEFIVFILIYIIPKGRYDYIKYIEQKDILKFIRMIKMEMKMKIN